DQEAGHHAPEKHGQRLTHEQTVALLDPVPAGSNGKRCCLHKFNWVKTLLVRFCASAKFAQNDGGRAVLRFPPVWADGSRTNATPKSVTQLPATLKASIAFLRR